MSKRFPYPGWPRRADIIGTAGVTLTASATPHTKGSWTDLIASTPFACCAILLSSIIDIGASSTDTSVLIDIGIGNTGDAVDATLVANIPIGAYQNNCNIWVPCHVPAGVRVAGRIQGAVVSETWVPFVWALEAGSPPLWAGYAFGEAIGINTATSGPTTGDLTDNAWDEAVASSGRAYKALSFHPCQVPGDNTLTAVEVYSVEIGVGGSGAEQVLGEFTVETQSSEELSRPLGAWIEVNVPAGSRLAIRKNGTADLSGAIVGWV